MSPARESCSSAPPTAGRSASALIGAGKFGSMYLAQVPRTRACTWSASPTCRPMRAAQPRARGLGAERTQAASLDEALRTAPRTSATTGGAGAASGRSTSSSNAPATRSPRWTTAWKRSPRQARGQRDGGGRRVLRPLLARKAAEAGVVYSLAFGDQPALICDLVDWARTCGFPVVAAGRGHKWLPHFCEVHARHRVGLLRPHARAGERGGLNPKMFNSFLDGSKPSIESTAVSNATGLAVPSNGCAIRRRASRTSRS
jgi:predicted homoserine dehydrogenase-like protein